MRKLDAQEYEAIMKKIRQNAKILAGSNGELLISVDKVALIVGKYTKRPPIDEKVTRANDQIKELQAHIQHLEKKNLKLQTIDPDNGSYYLPDAEKVIKDE